MPDGALLDILIKSGTPAVILGVGIYVLWKAYVRKDDANQALARDAINAINAATAAIEALTRGLRPGRRRR